MNGERGMSMMSFPLEHWLDRRRRAFEQVVSGDWETEFDWFVRDGAGAVAMVSTAARNRIPVHLLGQVDDYLKVFSCLFLLPIVSSVSVLGDGDRSDWQYFSERGVFGYDYSVNAQNRLLYELVSKPSFPINATELPEEINHALPCLRKAAVGTSLLDLSAECERSSTDS